MWVLVFLGELHLSLWSGSKGDGVQAPSMLTWFLIEMVCRRLGEYPLDLQCRVLLPGWVMGLWAT